MPGSVMSNTSAVEVIIQAVSAPLRVSAPTRPGWVRGAGAGVAGTGAEAATAGTATATRGAGAGPGGASGTLAAGTGAAGTAATCPVASGLARLRQKNRTHAQKLFLCIPLRLSSKQSTIW